MPEDTIVNVVLEVPVAMVKRGGYLPQYVSVFKLTQQHSEELRRLKSGLIASGATVEYPRRRRVESDASVFQWLLERVALARTDAQGGAVGKDVKDLKDLKDGKDGKDMEGGKGAREEEGAASRPAVAPGGAVSGKTAQPPVGGVLPGVEQVKR